MMDITIKIVLKKIG